jgi:hypothetical protein
MKKYCILFFCLCGLLSLPAQQPVATPDTPTWVYCELSGNNPLLRSKVFHVNILFGTENEPWSFHDDRVIDPVTNKDRYFSNMVDAMNFMSGLGWELVQAYSDNLADQRLTHWVLKLPVHRNEAGKLVPFTEK